MSARQRVELLLPGAFLGLLAGGLAGGLAALGGLSAGYVTASALGLGLPLAAAGAGYNALLAAGRVRLAGVTPAAVYWLACFPLARTVHELVLDVSLGQPLGLPHGTLPFLGYQAMVSAGFAVGFIWLHERVAPLWWIRIRDRNPVARGYVEAYMRQAVAEERRKAARAERKAAEVRHRRTAKGGPRTAEGRGRGKR